MMSKCGRFGWTLCVALALLLAHQPTPAQRPPRQESLSVTTSPGLVTFALMPSGISRGSFPVTITTTWRMQQGGTVVQVYAYFSTPPAALSSSTGGTIPSSQIFGRVNGAAPTAFTGVSPLSPGGSLRIFTQQVKGNKDATRSDSVELQIDTTGLSLPPGNYTGILRIQALAI